MAIYVDEIRNYPQAPKSGAERYFGNGKPSCHMTCSGDLDELHQFAQAMGLRRAWFQEDANIFHCHYDLTPGMRVRAIKAGAISMPRDEQLEMWPTWRASLAASSVVPSAFPDGIRVIDVRHGPYDLYIGRVNPHYQLAASKWANPYKEGANILRRFEEHIRARPDLVAALPELQGKVLACWCAPNGGVTLADPAICHGQILAKLLSEMLSGHDPNLSEDERHTYRTRHLLHHLAYLTYGVLSEGTAAQREWADGIRNTFAGTLCMWLAGQQEIYPQDEFTQRLAMLEREYLRQIAKIKSATWWIDHFHQAGYVISPHTGEGIQRFLQDAAAQGAREGQL